MKLIFFSLSRPGRGRHGVLCQAGLRLPALGLLPRALSRSRLGRGAPWGPSTQPPVPSCTFRTVFSRFVQYRPNARPFLPWPATYIDLLVPPAPVSQLCPPFRSACSSPLAHLSQFCIPTSVSEHLIAGNRLCATSSRQQLRKASPSPVRRYLRLTLMSLVQPQRPHSTALSRLLPTPPPRPTLTGPLQPTGARRARHGSARKRSSCGRSSSPRSTLAGRRSSGLRRAEKGVRYQCLHAANGKSAK